MNWGGKLREWQHVCVQCVCMCVSMVMRFSRLTLSRQEQLQLPPRHHDEDAAAWRSLEGGAGPQPCHSRSMQTQHSSQCSRDPVPRRQSVRHVVAAAGTCQAASDNRLADALHIPAAKQLKEGEEHHGSQPGGPGSCLSQLWVRSWGG